MAADYYEHIIYEGTNFLIAMARDTYVLSHMHRQAELALLLEGAADVRSNGITRRIEAGMFWHVDPYQCHEAFGVNGSFLFLELQIAPDFFLGYYPEMKRLRIDETRIAPAQKRLKTLLLQCAAEYFRREENYTLRCAALINDIIDELLKNVPHRFLSDAELQADSLRISRMQRINRYIEQHADEKLLLSQIADSEKLTLTYLSHFFSDCFGMPFQTYLSMVRCRRAAVMLTESEDTVTDISFSCGFSALKYMNRAFRRFFGQTPGEYRSQNRHLKNEHSKAFEHGPQEKACMASQGGSPFAPHFSAEESIKLLKSFNN